MRSRGPIWDVTGDDPDQASFVGDYEHLFRNRQQASESKSSGGGSEKPFWSPIKIIVAVISVLVIGAILKVMVAIAIGLLGSGIIPSWLVALICLIAGVLMLLGVILVVKRLLSR